MEGIRLIEQIKKSIPQSVLLETKTPCKLLIHKALLLFVADRIRPGGQAGLEC
jgi:hypothetical protein